MPEQQFEYILRHYLNRWIHVKVYLWRTRRLPISLLAFLLDACDRGVMKTSGVAFEFRHGLLLERLVFHGLAAIGDRPPRWSVIEAGVAGRRPWSRRCRFLALLLRNRLPTLARSSPTRRIHKEIDLASVLSDLGRYSDAASRLRAQVKPASERAHPATVLLARHNYASFLTQAGNLDEAEGELREVLSGRRECHGRDHVRSLNSELGLASVLRMAGRPIEAQELAERVVSARRRLLGEGHPDTLAARAEYAHICLKLGHDHRAVEQELHDVLENQVRTTGRGDLRTLDTQSLLARTMLRSGHGRASDAERAMIEVTGRLRSLFGSRHPRTLEAESWLIRSRIECGAHQAKELRARIDKLASVLGETHHIVMEIRDE